VKRMVKRNIKNHEQTFIGAEFQGKRKKGDGTEKYLGGETN